MDVKEDQAEHRVVATETLNYLTCSLRLTCSCGWSGHRNNWTSLAHGAVIPPLPPLPEPPHSSREEVRVAIHGEHRSRRRYYR
jgi:hypothetical protein